MTLETQKEFAERIGRDQSWVTRLKQAGRLVMDGRLVDAEASIARIAATDDLSKAGVAERHAAARANLGAQVEKAGAGFKVYQAMKMKADAEMAAMQRDRMAGELVLREAADFVISDLSAGVRARLDGLPARFAPILYPLETLEEVQASLREMVEEELRALEDNLRRRAKEWTAEAES